MKKILHVPSNTEHRILKLFVRGSATHPAIFTVTPVFKPPFKFTACDDSIFEFDDPTKRNYSFHNC